MFEFFNISIGINQLIFENNQQKKNGSIRKHTFNNSRTVFIVHMSNHFLDLFVDIENN